MAQKEKENNGCSALRSPYQSPLNQQNVYGNNSPMPEWPIESNPPGGFVRYLQNPDYRILHMPFPQYFANTQQCPENFYFTGGTSTHVPFSPIQSPVVNSTPPTPMADSTIGGTSSSGKKRKIQPEVVEVDDGEPTRTEKRLQWTDEEDIRLALG